MHTTTKKLWVMMMVIMGGMWSSAAMAENLGDILRKSGWNTIIGTWVDADTGGSNIRVRYAWKYRSHAIQVTSKMGDLQSTSLIGLNAGTGEVFMAGVNSRGGASLGKWIEEDGDAVLEAGYVSETGEKGSMRLRHHLEDDNTLIVTIPRENGRKVNIRLVRHQPAKKGKTAKEKEK